MDDVNDHPSITMDRPQEIVNVLENAVFSYKVMFLNSGEHKLDSTGKAL